ncbi:hypothetical protein D7I44_06925 [Gryllotalpicola protaetiae]|uniref:DUF2029 domain-containing protein n=1 Tax=Gryllotalpicola protaetiae TaxID=2419771 RepID=A0A387BKV7_9MICO|nr:hypothetical protein D7I44_06925 [Gryllotalpicola protaetiae]
MPAGALGRARLVVEFAALAVLTLAAYTALWLTQNALWTNGLVAGMTAQTPRPGSDPVVGLDATVRVIVLGAAVTGLAVWLFVRAERFAAAGLTWALITLPLVIAVALYFLPPTLSIDAYSYLSHGFLAATPGLNPYVDASSSVAWLPYGQLLLDSGWQAVHPVTPYGPLWTMFEKGAYLLSGNNVGLGILLIKLPSFLAMLGTAALIWRLLARIAPDRRLRGVLLFLANPLILIELAGEGHNDAVMIFFVVLAMFATVRRWAFVAVVAIALAVLVKASAAPLGLLVLVALVLWRRSARRLALELVAGVVVSAGAAVALFAPFWVGPATLNGLFTEAAAPPGLSIAGIVYGILRPGTAEIVLLALLVLPTVAACFLVRTVTGFIRACSIVSLLIFVLLPLEWPWYAALPSALLALGAAEIETVVIVLLALGSRVVAPFGDASAIGSVYYTIFYTAQAFLGQAVPGLVGLFATVARVIRERGWRADASAEAARELAPARSGN